MYRLYKGEYAFCYSSRWKLRQPNEWFSGASICR
ncbi:hypothetical protein OROMI_029334 [Orobanche minor]